MTARENDRNAEGAAKFYNPSTKRDAVKERGTSKTIPSGARANS